MDPNPHLLALQGLVPFVAPEELERRLGVRFRARLGANESVFGPSPLAVTAMQEAARSSHYGDPQSVELRAALAERHGGGPENYLVGAGIDGLFISLARAYLRPGMRVGTTRGGYPTFEYAVKGTGAELVYAEYGKLDPLPFLGGEAPRGTRGGGGFASRRDAEDAVPNSSPYAVGGEFRAASPSPGSQEKVPCGSKGDEVDFPDSAYPLTPTLSPLGGEGALPPSPSFHSGTPPCMQGGECPQSPSSGEGDVHAKQEQGAGLLRPNNPAPSQPTSSARFPLPGGGGFPRPDAAVLAALDADLLYLANPDNPSGALTPADEIQSLLRDDRLLVLDEAYADFVPEDQLLPIDLTDRRIVRFRTFSKAHGMAGQRIGYVMGHPDVLEPLSRVRPHFEVSIAAQAGALASLRDKNYTAAVIERYNAGRIELSQILQEAGLTPLPSSTNFVTAHVGTREEAEALLNRLLQRGVFIRKPALPPLDGCIRVTIGRPEDHAILAAALRPD